jgi:hypothetical protein
LRSLGVGVVGGQGFLSHAQVIVVTFLIYSSNQSKYK